MQSIAGGLRNMFHCRDAFCVLAKTPTYCTRKKSSSIIILRQSHTKKTYFHSDFNADSRFILTLPFLQAHAPIYNNWYFSPSLLFSVRTCTTQYFWLLKKTVKLSLAPGSRGSLINTLCCWAVTMQQFLGFPRSRCLSAYYYDIVILKLESCPEDFPQGLQVSLL